MRLNPQDEDLFNWSTIYRQTRRLPYTDQLLGGRSFHETLALLSNSCSALIVQLLCLASRPETGCLAFLARVRILLGANGTFHFNLLYSTNSA